MGFTPLKKSFLGSEKRKVDVKKKNFLIDTLKSLVARCPQEKESS